MRTLEKTPITDVFTPIGNQDMTQILQSTTNFPLGELFKDCTDTSKVEILSTMDKMNMYNLYDLSAHKDYKPCIRTLLARSEA